MDFENLQSTTPLTDIKRVSDNGDSQYAYDFAEKLERLIIAQSKYIDLLSKCMGKSSSFLAIHNWRDNEEDVKTGENLRKEIEKCKCALDKKQEGIIW